MLQIASDDGFTRTVDVSYLLYLPGDYGQDPQRQWPLILFLHGAGERGYDPQDITRYSIPAFLTTDLDFPFIVLSPQSLPDNWWSNQVDVLDALLNQVQATYAVDPKRIYLTGQSMGGFGTWAMVKALQDCSGNVRFTLYPDADHLESLNRAYADPELYEWLQKQTLK